MEHEHHDLPFEGARFAVDAALAGERLDRALARLLPDVSRARLQELVKDGGVKVDGTEVHRAARPLAAGEVLEVTPLARARTRAGGPAGGALDVVYEDEYLVAIDKPAGTVVHPSTVVRGGTVSELAVERFGPLPTAQGEDRPGIVHRLDADTSGLLLIAKEAAAAEGLVEAFRERRVEKTYLAIVRGDPRFDTDWIEAPIARAESRGDRMAVAPTGEGRAAETYFEVRERFDGCALLEVQPKTGRTHQIRVHLAWYGHPVLGDALYRARRGRPVGPPSGAPLPQRQALHASRLALAHPVSGARLELEAPLAPDIAALVDWLRATSGAP